MDKEHKYRFSNSGKPYEISIGGRSNGNGISLYDGNLSIYDDDVLSVELECKNGFLRKNYTIKVRYLFGGFLSKTECSKTIDVTANEIESAKEVCAKASDIICRLKEAKEAYKREQNEKTKKSREEDTIDALDIDGNEIKIWRRQTYFGDTVLFADGASTFHTHADCFEFWKPMYKRNFKKWQIIKMSEAEKMGLHECKICEKYYDDDDVSDEFINEE